MKPDLTVDGTTGLRALFFVTPGTFSGGATSPTIRT